MASSSGFLGLNEELAKPAATLAGFLVSVAGVLGSSHIKAAITLALCAALIFTIAFCLEHKGSVRFKSIISVGALAAFTLAGLFFLKLSGGSTVSSSTQASFPSQTSTESKVSNSAAVNGNVSSAISGGNGNQVTITVNPQSAKPPVHLEK